MLIGAFLIARLSSSRLPQKCMMKILDKPMIELMVERVRMSNLVDKIIIATSNLSSDDPLEELAHKLGVGCHRGSLDNVMERIYEAAEKYKCEHIVELLGDNPLVHYDLIDDVVKFYKDGSHDYAATVTKEYPISKTNPGIKLFSVGIRVQVYSRKVAEKYVDYPEYVHDEDKGTTAYIYENPESFKLGYLEAKEKWSFMNKPDLTFAVNYQKNFDLIKTFFEKQYPFDPNFSLEKVYGQLDEEKHLYQLMGNE